MCEILILLLSSFYVLKMHQIKRFISPLFLVLLIVITPLVFSKKTVDINYAPQFYFHAISCLIFILLTWIFQRENKFKIYINIGIYLIAAYILMSIFSLLFAQNRQEGIIEIYKIGSWIVLILVLYHLIQEEENRLVMLKCILVIGFILSMIGFLQLTKIAFTELPGNVIPYATLGNRNIYIPAILILLPFIIYHVFYAIDLKWKYFSAIAALLILIVVVWSLMRTAMIGIGLTVIINLIILILLNAKVKLFLSKHPFVKFAFPLLMALFLVGFGIGIMNKFQLKHDKRKNLLNLNSTNERAVLWKNSIAMVNAYPLTGVGAGNWKIMLPHYGLKDLPPEARRAEMFYMRPENDFLWVFAETGIIGGISYLGIFLFAFVACQRKIRNSILNSERHFGMVVLNALVLYVVIAFFGFPKDRTYLQIELAIIIAFSLFFYNENRQNVRMIKLPILVIFACYALFFFKGYQLFAAEKKLSKLIEARKNNQHELVLDYCSSIIKNNYLMDQTSTPVYFYEGVAYFSMQNIDRAIASFHQAEQLHPYHLHVLNNLATCYSIKGDFNKSIGYLEKALLISPDFQEAIINLSGLHYNLRNYKAAYKYFFLARTDNKQNQLYVNLDAIISKAINDSLFKLAAEYIEVEALEKAKESLKSCLHKNKFPQYHALQLAIVRKRQQMNLLKK